MAKLRDSLERLKALSAKSGMAIVDLSELNIDKSVVDRVPVQTAKQYKIMPIGFEKKTLTVALADPLDLRILDDLRFRLNYNIKGVIADEAEIEKAIQKYYGLKVEKLEAEAPEEAKEGVDRAGLEKLASQAPVVKLLDLVLLQAVKDKASDIHFEPFEDKFLIRYRVDGVLYEISPPPKRLSLALISRIKVMANLDIAERRLPQDGRISTEISGRNVDLRVSTLPTVFGESVVIRVLDKGIVALSLDQLGFAPDLLKMLKDLIHRPNGIILVTGPTGCGKTTTLYSCLKEINKPEFKMLTAEDPVEYDIPGIIQIPINPKIGLTFTTSLRSMLRQDPDIVMVGEARDQETARIAIQASLTGHLVFSTLHTNDAVGAITRLMDMGVEPYLITSSVEVVIAQRLVRTICPKCKESYQLLADSPQLKDLGLKTEGGKLKAYRGKGCESCHNTGYKGRTAIAELFVMSDPIRALALERNPTSILRQKAQELGMKTLREDGLNKIYDGITTIEEVIRETKQYV